MAAKSRFAGVPLGKEGMVARENRLLVTPSELLDAEGVTFEDHSVQKEGGALTLDQAGVSGTSRYTATLSASSSWFAGLAAFKSAGPIASVKAIGTGTTNSGTSVSISVPVGGVAAGNLLAVWVGFSPFSGDPVSSYAFTVTDAQGNTYSAATDQSTTVFGSEGQLFYTVVTTPLLAADAITVTKTSVAAPIVAVAHEFSGTFSSPLDADLTATGTGTSATVGPVSASQVPVLLVAGVTASPTGTTFTAGATFTESAEAGTTGNSAQLAYRIDTTSPVITSLYDWNPDLITAAAPGTASTVSGSTAVTGSGLAAFTTRFSEGDSIQIGNETHRVVSVESDTALTTATPWLTTNTTVAFTFITLQRLILATSDGNIFAEMNGNLDAISVKSGLKPALEPGRFVAGGKEAAANDRKLFYFSGRDVVQVIPSSTLAAVNLATPPTDWSGDNQPVNGVIHRNRLCGFGNRNDPHRLYFSDPDDHTNFTSAAAFNMRVASDVGTRIWNAVSFQGVLFVFKYPHGVFYIDDSDLDPTNWFYRAKSVSVGCAPSPYSVLSIDDDVLFMAADGAFHLLTAVSDFGGVRASNVSYALGISKWLRDNVNVGRLALMTSAWYQHKRLAMFGVPGSGSNANNLTLKFDFGDTLQADGRVKFSYSRRDRPAAYATRRETSATDVVEKPIVGEGGSVFLLDRTERHKRISTSPAVDVAYTGTFRTPNVDYSHAEADLLGQRKMYEALELIFEPVSTGTVTVDVYIDLELRETLTLDATQSRHRVKINVGDGYMSSVKVTNDTLDESFKVLAVLLWVKPGNEDQNRGV